MNSDNQTQVPILSEASCFVEEREITFTSYEDIKRELDHYIGGQVVSQELPDSYIAKGRLNAYMITSFPDDPTKFIVSAYTYNKVRYGCSFWDYIEHEFDLLCEYLYRIYEVRLQEKEHNLEHAYFIVPADSVFIGEETVTGFSSYDAIINALNYAIVCSNHNPYDIKEKELQESWFVISPVVNNPKSYNIALYVPNDKKLYIKYPNQLSSDMENYRICVEEHERKIVEAEAYYEKQFEEYLRLNPVTSEDLEAADTSEAADESEEVVNLEDDDDLPPLGLATAESVARANEILSAYNNQARENTLLNVDEDIYVYDGIDIYE
jgi:hypothetical protein